MHPAEGIREMIDVSLKMMDCLLTMMDLVLKMMDCEGVHKRAPIRLWNLHPLHGRAQ